MKSVTFNFAEFDFKLNCMKNVPIPLNLTLKEIWENKENGNINHHQIFRILINLMIYLSIVFLGTSVHEETSWKAFEKVWEFIDLMLEERLNPKPENFKRKAEVTEKTEVKGKVRKLQVRIKDFFKGSKIKDNTENQQSKETVDEVGEDVAAGYVDVSENTKNDVSSTDVRENKNKLDSKKSEFLENQNNGSEIALTKEVSQESDMDIGSGNNKVDRQNNPIMEDGENSKTIENKKNESEIVEIKNMEVESKSNEDDGQDTKITENKNEVDIEKIEITENQNNRVEHVLAKEDESDIDVESANNNSDGDDKTKDNEDVEADKANDEYGESKTTKDDGDKETTENKKSENDYTQAKSDFQEINIDVDKFSNSQENGKEESLSQTPSEEL